MSKSIIETIKSAISCKDTNYIHKVPNAGSIVTTPNGENVQVMHNGVLVLVDAYYGSFMTEIVAGLNGHHEPQEEKIFHEILKCIQPKATMVELGAYWSYYSLWFQSYVKDPSNYMVEPLTNAIDVGKKNFDINGKKGTFIQAYIGSNLDNLTQPKTITVDYILESENLNFIDILHSDIQGHEYDMLLGAQNSIQAKKIQFIFISTHGLIVHSKCLRFLRKNDFFIIASHTPLESYSFDGLIVATSDPKFFQKIHISKKRVNPYLYIKSILAKLYSIMK